MPKRGTRGSRARCWADGYGRFAPSGRKPLNSDVGSWGRWYPGIGTAELPAETGMPGWIEIEFLTGTRMRITGRCPPPPDMSLTPSGWNVAVCFAALADGAVAISLPRMRVQRTLSSLLRCQPASASRGCLPGLPSSRMLGPRWGKFVDGNIQVHRCFLVTRHRAPRSFIGSRLKQKSLPEYKP